MHTSVVLHPAFCADSFLSHLNQRLHSADKKATRTNQNNHIFTNEIITTKLITNLFSLVSNWDAWCQYSDVVKHVFQWYEAHVINSCWFWFPSAPSLTAKVDRALVITFARYHLPKIVYNNRLEEVLSSGNYSVCHSLSLTHQHIVLFIRCGGSKDIDHQRWRYCLR